jgi:hypothetical protein
MAKHHFSRKGVRTRNSGRTPRGTDGSGDDRSLPDAVYTYLRQLTPVLRVAFCASSTAAMALSYQAAERDEEIAAVLDQSCCTPLLAELDKLRKLLPRIDARKPSTPPTPHKPRHGSAKE